MNTRLASSADLDERLPVIVGISMFVARVLSALFLIVAAVTTLPAGAATTTGVVDIPTRGVTQRILYTPQ